MVRGGRTGWIIAQAMMGWFHVDVLKLKKEVGETCRRHANTVSKDQPTLIIESRK